MTAIRIQLAVGSTLIGEVIVPQAMASATADRWLAARHRAGKPMGGTVSGRADLPRYWDVPVGADVSGDERVSNVCGWCGQVDDEERSCACRAEGE